MFKQPALGWYRGWLQCLGLVGRCLDRVGDFLRRLAKLGDPPVGGVSLGHVVGLGVVDQPLGERGGSISSRSAKVMKKLRRPWSQNFALAALPMGA